MSLLSEAEDREIRDAVKLVTDTFMQTPVKYYTSNQDSIDHWGEDLEDETLNELDLKGLLEYQGNDADKIKQDIDGSIDMRDIILTFNLEDIQAVGMINADFSHKFTQETDYLITQSQTYKVTDIYMDGPLSQKNVLFIVRAKYVDTAKQLINE